MAGCGRDVPTVDCSACSLSCCLSWTAAWPRSAILLAKPHVTSCMPALCLVFVLQGRDTMDEEAVLPSPMEPHPSSFHGAGGSPIGPRCAQGVGRGLALSLDASVCAGCWVSGLNRILPGRSALPHSCHAYPGAPQG